jgi:hypothetical protein
LKTGVPQAVSLTDYGNWGFLFGSAGLAGSLGFAGSTALGGSAGLAGLAVSVDPNNCTLSK